jgi:hypothetical protein
MRNTKGKVSHKISAKRNSANSEGPFGSGAYACKKLGFVVLSLILKNDTTKGTDYGI